MIREDILEFYPTGAQSLFFGQQREITTELTKEEFLELVAFEYGSSSAIRYSSLALRDQVERLDLAERLLCGGYGQQFFEAGLERRCGGVTLTLLTQLSLD